MKETVKTRRPVLTILILLLILSALSTSAVRADGRSYSSEDAVILAKLVWGEARGLDVTQQAAVVWCVLNRVEDAAFPDSMQTVVTQKWQFSGYSESNPIAPDILALVYDVLARWSIEQSCVGGVGRVLPRDYLFFAGNGIENRFRKEYRDTEIWDWSLSTPYVQADASYINKTEQIKKGAMVFLPKLPQ